MADKKSESGEYWNRHVVSWEASTYYTDKDMPKPNAWDRFSTYFRGASLYDRMTLALEMLQPYLKGLTVLDVGCASGRFANQLLEAGAARVIGVDISEDIIRIANERRLAGPHKERLEFFAADLAKPASLPKVDLVTSLGVIEYFDRDDMQVFLGNTKADYFFHDFPDVARTTNWLLWWMRQVYIRVNQCPGVYLYKRDEFSELVKQAGFAGEVWYERRSIFHYASNLPRNPAQFPPRG
ncbi:MAG: Ubiquinone biosynthesis O-methyltransferase [Anaerolineales bacterium]|nr:Ubiquinone biosynthesis O-methyltransferase [Anaerolineales bacterium]